MRRNMIANVGYVVRETNQSITLYKQYKKQYKTTFDCSKMVYEQSRICPREWGFQNPLGFWDNNGSPNLAHVTVSHKSQEKKKRTF